MAKVLRTVTVEHSALNGTSLSIPHIHTSWRMEQCVEVLSSGRGVASEAMDSQELWFPA